MNRFKDYLNFAVCFAGIGYAVLWPLAAVGDGGKPFGASVLCGGLFDALCRAPHPITLPPALHLLGALSAIALGLRLLCRGWRHRRRARATAEPMPPAEPPAMPLRTRLRTTQLTQPLRPVRPRHHFGLRGTNRATEAQDMA